MVGRRISSDLKECALRLWNSGWDMQDLTEVLGVSQSSVYRWQEIFEQYGATERRPSSLKGPARIITRAVLTAIEILYRSEPDLYLDELVLWLGVEHNIVISAPALHATLKRAGLTRKILRKLAIERNEELREEWRQMQASDDFLDDGSQFICLDETSKNEHTLARRYGRAYAGERAELKDVFVRGDRYSLLAAMSVDGYIACEVVPGSFDSIEFLEFVQDKVVCNLPVLLYMTR